MSDHPIYTSRLGLFARAAMDKLSTDELLALLTVSDDEYAWVVRSMAGSTLHMRPSRRVFDAVVSLADSVDPRARGSSAFVLGQLGSPGRPYFEESAPLLLRLLQDDEASVRAAAGFAHAHLYGSPLEMSEEVEMALLAATRDESADVREGAAFALAWAPIASESVEAALARLENDPVPSVADMASFAKEVRDEER